MKYLHFHETYGHCTWQTGEWSWVTATSKVTWHCDHVATWSHATNKNRYLSFPSKAMTARLGKVEINNGRPPSTKSCDTLTIWLRDHVTNKKRYISTFATTIAKKLDRVVGFNAGLLSARSHDLLIMWPHKKWVKKSYNKWKTL